MDRMKYPPLYVLNGISGVALIPASVEVFCGSAELDDQDAGQVLRFTSPRFSRHSPDQGRLVVTHDYSGVRAAYKGTSIAQILHRQPHEITMKTYIYIIRFATENL